MDRAADLQKSQGLGSLANSGLRERQGTWWTCPLRLSGFPSLAEAASGLCCLESSQRRGWGPRLESAGGWAGMGGSAPSGRP